MDMKNQAESIVNWIRANCQDSYMKECRDNLKRYYSLIEAACLNDSGTDNDALTVVVNTGNE